MEVKSRKEFEKFVEMRVEELVNMDYLKAIKDATNVKDESRPCADCQHMQKMICIADREMNLKRPCASFRPSQSIIIALDLADAATYVMALKKNSKTVTWLDDYNFISENKRYSVVNPLNLEELAATELWIAGKTQLSAKQFMDALAVVGNDVGKVKIL